MGDTMAVRAKWCQIVPRVDDIAGPHHGDGHKVMDFDQPGGGIAVDRGELQVAGLAGIAMEGERGGAVAPVTFIAVDLYPCPRALGHPPALFLQLLRLALIALDVGREPARPELSVRRWRGRKASARMTVPVAPVHEERDPVPRKNEVRRPRKIAPLEAESKPRSMGRPPYPELRRSVPPADGQHVRRALRWCDALGHGG